MIPDKFKDYPCTQSFSHKIINIKPEELHDKHQQCNKKHGYKGSDKGFNYQLIKFFNHKVVFNFNFNDMRGTKLHFSDQEFELYKDTRLILTKNAIIQKLKFFLEELQLRQQNILHNFPIIPGEVLEISPKVSKGENYKGLPWLVLDYPRHFKPGNIFAIRTLFWWGNFFSTTLHLSGIYKKTFGDKILSLTNNPTSDNFFICISDDQWQHHFEISNFLPLKEIPAEEIKKIQARSFIKLGKKIPLEQPDAVAEILCNDYEEIVRMLGC